MNEEDIKKTRAASDVPLNLQVKTDEDSTEAAINFIEIKKEINTFTRADIKKILHKGR